MSFISNNGLILSSTTELSTLLGSRGHHTIITTDALQTLRLLATGLYDLCILDTDDTVVDTMLDILKNSSTIPMRIAYRYTGEMPNKKLPATLIVAMKTLSDTDFITLIESSTIPTDHVNESKKKRKILIIDDTSELLEMYRLTFTLKGYDIQTAIDGLDGITKASSWSPDIILLDIMMPHMDGFEMMRVFKNNTSLASTIVVNSNIDGTEIAEKIYRAGADFYLRKSDFTPGKIITMIEAGIFDHKRDTMSAVPTDSFKGI